MALTIDINLRLNGSANAAEQLDDVSASVTQVGETAHNASNQLATGVGGVSDQLRNMGKLAIGFFAFDKLKDYAVKAIELADAWSVLNSKMELATGSSELATAATSQLYEMAQKLRVPLADAGTLFSRLVPSMKEYGGGTAEAMRMTELLSMSLAISGATTAEAGSAMLQFSQAMSAGKMSGDEFNAVADAAPRFLQALADGLGKPRGELKKLAEQGMLTTDQIYNALSKQLPKLEGEFSRIPLTVGASWTLLANAAMKGVGELDGAFKKLDSDYKISESIAYGIKAVADNLPAVARGFVILAEAVAAYYLVMRGGPALIGAVSVAKDLLTAAMVRWQASAVTGTSIWTRLNTAFSTSPGLIARSSTALGALTVAGSALAAAFIGWEIGKWLTDNFAEARIAGAVFFEMAFKGLEYLKYGFSVAIEYVAAYGAALTGNLDPLRKLDGKLVELTKTRDKELQLITESVAATIEDEGARGKVTTATNKQKVAADSLNKAHKISAEDAQKLQTEFGKLTDSLGDQADSLRLTANGQAQLTDTQKLTAKATEFLTKMGDNLTASQRKQLQVFIQTLPQLEQQAVAAKKVADAQAQYTKKLDDNLAAVQGKLAKAIEERDSMGKTDAQVRALTLSRDRETLATLLAKQATEGHSTALDNNIQTLRDTIAAEEDLNNILTDNEGLKAQQDQIKANNEEWKKSFESIQGGLTDALMRAFESGKGYGEAFKSTLINSFKTMVLRPMISGVIGSVFGGGAASGAAGGSAGGGIMGGIMNAVSMGKAAYSFLNGGMLTSLSNSIVSLGAKLGSNFLQDFGGSMVGGASPFATGGTASMLGQYAGKAIPIVGGYMIGSGINSAISGGYSVSGGMNTAQQVGTAVASFFGGPIGGAIAGAVGGLINRAFGMGEKKVKSFGIEGSFAGDDFSGQNYTNWKQKGGWFRSDKKGTEYSALDSELESSLDSGFIVLKKSIAGYADALGLNATSVEKYTKKIQLQLSDDEALNSEKIANLFNEMADEMAFSLLPSADVFAQFSKSGETYSATLQRLASAFDVTNSAASLLGANFEAAFSGIGLSSAAARQSLIDFSGGLESFSQKIGFYFDNFYTDSEKAARGFAELDAKFDLLGLNVGLDKAAFRAEMEKVDVAGDPARYAALLDIAPLFTQILEAMGDGAVGQSIGVGVDAKGLSEKQLADINTSAQSWWSTYQPELKAQTDQAVKTTDAILNLTNVTSTSSAGIQAAIVSGNAQLQQIIAEIQASGMSAEAQGRAIYEATLRAGQEMASATAAALAEGSRL